MTAPEDDASHDEAKGGRSAVKAWLVELATQLASEFSIAWVFQWW